MNGKTLGNDEKILIEIPDNICKLYNLKPSMEFEMKASEQANSKLIISILLDVNNK